MNKTSQYITLALAQKSHLAGKILGCISDIIFLIARNFLLYSLYRILIRKMKVTVIIFSLRQRVTFPFLRYKIIFFEPYSYFKWFGDFF